MRRLPKVLLLVLASCHQAGVTRTTPSGGGDTPMGGAGGGPIGGAGGNPGVGSTPADAGSPSSQPVGGATCAEEDHKAEQPPADLLVLLDNSASMSTAVEGATKTKASLVREALIAFARDPRSTGIGLGLQLFPTPPAATCMTDADCPGLQLPGLTACRPRRACAGPDTVPGVTTPCTTVPSFVAERCPSPTRCVDVGICSLSGTECYAVGQPCPGGMAGDLCQAGPNVCSGVRGLNCAVADYEKLDLPILPLPAAHTPLVHVLGLGEISAGTFFSAGPGTPTGPAVAGALNRLRQQQAAHPTHRVALVMATDGMPSGCMPNDAAGIAALASRAWTERPAIATYVIGVQAADDPDARPLLDQVAAAGGTGSAFILDAKADLGQRFRDALDKIRVAQLPCEFTIPQPSRGAVDFTKVNVRFTAAGAPPDTLPYVGSVDRCDPMRGGWYYDVAPEQATPTRVLICPASCTRFEGAPAASVSLAYGCKTMVIQ
jgi:hypothetical protein